MFGHAPKRMLEMSFSRQLSLRDLQK